MSRNKLSFLVTVSTVVVLVLTAFNLSVPSTASAQTALYKSCLEQEKPTGLITPEPAATASATLAATEAAAAPGADDFAFLRVVAAESEACYQSTEVFLDNNFLKIAAGFNVAVGVTKSIDGEIALNKANAAGSKIGDITINISEFKSDNDRRDGIIRRQFLESNKYPYATLTGATLVGLPARAVTDGETLKFQIKGVLTVHDTKRDTTFDATGSFTGGTLVVSASSIMKMSDFGVQTPDIGGLVKADDVIRIIVNLVAREGQAATATPAK